MQIRKLWNKIKALLVLFAITLFAFYANAEVTYSLEPIGYEENTDCYNSDLDYIVGAFQSFRINFPEQVFIDRSKFPEVTVEFIEPSDDIVEGVDIDIYNSGTNEVEFYILSSPTILSGSFSSPARFRISFPQGIFGDSEWKESNHTKGLSNIAFQHDTYRYGDPEPPYDEIKSIAASPIKIYSNNGNIEISGKPTETTVTIYTIDGHCAYAGKDSVIALHSGIYIVNIESLTHKLTVR